MTPSKAGCSVYLAARAQLSGESFRAAGKLAQRGIAFAGNIVKDPPMCFAFFEDPDGVELYLAERSEWQ